MTIDPDNIFIRWTYYFNTRHRPPAMTSLCAVFWRGCVFMPLTVFFLLFGMGSLAFVLGIGVFHHWRGVLVVCAMIGFIVLAIMLPMPSGGRQRRTNKSITEAIDGIVESAAWRGLVAVKQRICPIIYIEPDSADR